MFIIRNKNQGDQARPRPKKKSLSVTAVFDQNITRDEGNISCKTTALASSSSHHHLVVVYTKHERTSSCCCHSFRALRPLRLWCSSSRPQPAAFMQIPSNSRHHEFKYSRVAWADNPWTSCRCESNKTSKTIGIRTLKLTVTSNRCSRFNLTLLSSAVLRSMCPTFKIWPSKSTQWDCHIVCNGEHGEPKRTTERGLS